MDAQVSTSVRQGPGRGSRAHAFTLIELLIVVAIIAILAAIAVPNFLDAQVRSKVSRVYSDMRSLKLGLEAYMVDNNSHAPTDFITDEYKSWSQITTPIAYVTSIPVDVFFHRPGERFDRWSGAMNQPYGYAANSPFNSSWDVVKADRFGVKYAVFSKGPGMVWVGSVSGSITMPNYWDSVVRGREASTDLLYDASNGTRSRGNLIMTNLGMYNQQ